MTPLHILAGALLLLGLITTTLAVVGTMRRHDLYVRLQSASKGLVLGVVAVLAASIGTSDPAIPARAAVAAVFLLLTAAVASHAMALVHHREGESRASGKEAEED